MYLQHDEVQALAPSSDKTQQLGGFADEKTQSTHEILNSLWLANHASMMSIIIVYIVWPGHSSFVE